MGSVDEHWADECVISGLGSGEGLIDGLADSGDKPVDKRCLVVESELARMLAVCGREGSTMSAILRDSWDSGTLSLRKVGRKLCVKGAHVSLIGHITKTELLRRLDNTELANGLCNRMLWGCAKRSKLLPHGGGSPDLSRIMRTLQTAKDHAIRLGNTRICMDDNAEAYWEKIYPALSSSYPGMLGDVTSRAEAQVVRLALIYALQDCKDRISSEHLFAAESVWNYCFNSCRFIWGNALGDPTADAILTALRSAGSTGLTRSDISALLGKNKPAIEIERALGVLVSHGLVTMTPENTGGRPALRYRIL
jgi:hypothetical protein